MNNDHDQPTAPATEPRRLIPERLAYLLEDRPLLWCEDADEYDALLAEIFAELDPKGVIECVLAKDIADYFWEIRRMRALRLAAVHAELPIAAAALLERGGSPMLNAMNASAIRVEVFAAAAGRDLQARSLAERMSAAHVTPQMMQYEALKSGLGAMTAIETSIVRLERRRDQLLKLIAERRQAFRAMARGLIERDETELVEVPEGRPH